ncbi:hypothetical protein K438DRAFT_1960016 [Mycena galopus ATCC 62051]|nr:hypothetical protein K438DRAFT_1960016 [Mycena galopus ATCC 62051]
MLCTSWLVPNTRLLQNPPSAMQAQPFNTQYPPAQPCPAPHGWRGDKTEQQRPPPVLQLLHDGYDSATNAASSAHPLALHPEQFPHTHGPLASCTLRSCTSPQQQQEAEVSVISFPLAFPLLSSIFSPLGFFLLSRSPVPDARNHAHGLFVSFDWNLFQCRSRCPYACTPSPAAPSPFLRAFVEAGITL